jgi:hypothetical protein
MPDLSFEVAGVEAPAFAAIPTLVFKLHISNANEHECIHTVALRCQIQIAVTRRRYSSAEQRRLLEVFGEPRRWGTTLRNLLWTHASTTVPRFAGNTVVDLPVPCTYDFEIVGTKYFHALEEGDMPLLFLFSGTIFYEGSEGALQVSQIPWTKEAAFRVPVALWQEMMACYYPNSVWLRLRKDVFDQFFQYKAAHSLPTWEDALVRLLQASGEEART